MLRMSVGILPLVPFLYQYWLGIAVLALILARARTSPLQASDLKRLRAFPTMKNWTLAVGALGVAPLTALGLGLGFWEASPALATWLVGGFWFLGAAEVAIGAWLVWRYQPRAGSMFLVSCAAVTWMAGSIVVATMAVTGTWL